MAATLELKHLTERWFPLPNHAGVLGFYHSTARYNVAHPGRRAFKSENGKRRLCRRAITWTGRKGIVFPACAPTRDQAKRIFWKDLKDLIPVAALKHESRSKDISDGELIIRLWNDAEIRVVGMDKPDRIEGEAIGHALLDEFGNMKESVWTENMEPAVVDADGTADFIGVPEGRNHYYELAELARADRTGEWAVHHWRSEPFLNPVTLAQIKARIDELTYEQEYGGQFVNFAGQAYWAWDREEHLVDDLPYYPDRDLIFTKDFNVEPGAAVMAQEHTLAQKTLAIDEIYVEKNSTTRRICTEFLKRYHKHRGDVLVHGDATGGARSTKGDGGSDWDEVKACLRPVFGDRLKFRVPKANPPERARVSAVNTRLMSHSRHVGLAVSKKKCPKLVRDLEGVRCNPDGSLCKTGKGSDPKLTHISDGLGYYIAKKYPVRRKIFIREEH